MKKTFQSFIPKVFLPFFASLYLSCSGTPALSGQDASTDARMQNTSDAALADSFLADAGKTDACIPEKEICNNEDDDCDGSIDEDYQAGESCPFPYLNTSLTGQYICTSSRESACQPLCTLEEICLKQSCEDGGCTCPEEPLCPDAPVEEPFACLEDFLIPISINEYRPPFITLLEEEIIFLEPSGDNSYRIQRFDSDFNLLDTHLIGFNTLQMEEEPGYANLLIDPELVSRSGDFIFFPGRMESTESRLGVVAYDLTHEQPKQFIPLSNRNAWEEEQRILLFRSQRILDVHSPSTEGTLQLEIEEYSPDKERWFSQNPVTYGRVLCTTCPGTPRLRSLTPTGSGFLAYWHPESAKEPGYFIRRLSETFEPEGETVSLDIPSTRTWLVQLSAHPLADGRYMMFWYGDIFRPTFQLFSAELEPLCTPQELPLDWDSTFEASWLRNGNGFAVLGHDWTEQRYTLARYNRNGHPVGQEESFTYTTDPFPQNRIVGRENDYLLLVLNGSEGPHQGVVVPGL